MFLTKFDLLALFSVVPFDTGMVE